MKRIALYPGSFDPITNGHLDIVRRGLKIFDEIVILVAQNLSVHKEVCFTVEERTKLIAKVFSSEPRVKVDQCFGLIMDYAREHRISTVLRGLRATGDFENEFAMASMNRDLNGEVETLFMVTGKEWFFISSSAVKEIAAFQGNVGDYVPSEVAMAIVDKLKKSKK